MSSDAGVNSVGQLKVAKPFTYSGGIKLAPSIELSGVQTVEEPNYRIFLNDAAKRLSVRENADANITIISGSDTLECLDLSKTNHSLLIAVPKGTVINEPAIVNIEIKDETFASATGIDVASGCSLTLIIKKTSESKMNNQAYFGERLKLRVGEGANVNIILIQAFEESATCHESLEAELERDASLVLNRIILGSGYTMSKNKITLKGAGASSKINVFFAGAGEQKFDIYAEHSHEGESTFSNILAVGALAGNAKAMNRGLIRIGKYAKQSSGYEKQDCLILSDSAEAYAIPNLEIHNHDVKCSHGSSIGKLNEDKIFYLMSRGFSREDAMKTVVEGYFNMAVHGLSIELQEKIISELNIDKLFKVKSDSQKNDD